MLLDTAKGVFLFLKGKHQDKKLVDEYAKAAVKRALILEPILETLAAPLSSLVQPALESVVDTLKKIQELVKDLESRNQCYRFLFANPAKMREFGSTLNDDIQSLHLAVSTSVLTFARQPFQSSAIEDSMYTAASDKNIQPREIDSMQFEEEVEGRSKEEVEVSDDEGSDEKYGQEEGQDSNQQLEVEQALPVTYCLPNGSIWSSPPDEFQKTVRTQYSEEFAQATDAQQNAAVVFVENLLSAPERLAREAKDVGLKEDKLLALLHMHCRHLAALSLAKLRKKPRKTFLEPLAKACGIVHASETKVDPDNGIFRAYSNASKLADAIKQRLKHVNERGEEVLVSPTRVKYPIVRQKVSGVAYVGIFLLPVFPHSCTLRYVHMFISVKPQGSLIMLASKLELGHVDDLKKLKRSELVVKLFEELKQNSKAGIAPPQLNPDSNDKVFTCFSHLLSALFCQLCFCLYVKLCFFYFLSSTFLVSLFFPKIKR